MSDNEKFVEDPVLKLFKQACDNIKSVTGLDVDPTIGVTYGHDALEKEIIENILPNWNISVPTDCTDPIEYKRSQLEFRMKSFYKSNYSVTGEKRYV